MRKVLSILLVFAMALSVVGCSPKTEDDAENVGNIEPATKNEFNIKDAIANIQCDEGLEIQKEYVDVAAYTDYCDEHGTECEFLGFDIAYAVKNTTSQPVGIKAYLNYKAKIDDGPIHEEVIDFTQDYVEPGEMGIVKASEVLYNMHVPEGYEVLTDDVHFAVIMKTTADIYGDIKNSTGLEGEFVIKDGAEYKERYLIITNTSDKEIGNIDDILCYFIHESYDGSESFYPQYLDVDDKTLSAGESVEVAIDLNVEDFEMEDRYEIFSINYWGMQ